MQNNIYKKIGYLMLAMLCSAYFVPTVSAVSLQLEGPAEPVLVNQDFQIKVVLDAEGQNINALGARVAWPSDLEIQSILTAESIVSLWPERPHYDGESLIFSGVMPGGYSGSYSNAGSKLLPGTVMSLVVRAKQVSESMIKFTELSAYPNDGSGQALSLEKPELKVSAYGNPVTETGKAAAIKNDKTPPQDLVASIERSPDVADNQWFVAFAARDQESGIANFYISESKSSELGADWLPVGSPFVLTDQSRTKYILIKAVDLNGNESLITLPPLLSEVPSLSGKTGLIKVVISAILLVVIVVLMWLIKKFRRVYER